MVETFIFVWWMACFFGFIQNSGWNFQLATLYQMTSIMEVPLTQDIVFGTIPQSSEIMKESLYNSIKSLFNRSKYFSGASIIFNEFSNNTRSLAFSEIKNKLSWILIIFDHFRKNKRNLIPKTIHGFWIEWNRKSRKQ